MSREEIRRVFVKLYAGGIRFVFVQGGEPFVRKDICHILEDLCDIGLRLVIITNGTRLTQQIAVTIAKLPIHIAVSLDTLDRERYKTIRGADQLEQTLCGIETLRDFPRPSFIVCIVSDVNREDVFEVGEFARHRGMIPIFGAYHWNIGKYGKENDLLQYESAIAAELFRKIGLSGLVPRGYFSDYVEDTEIWLKGKALEPCDAGRYSIAIDASGNVSPCLAHPHAGNLLVSELDQILQRFDEAAIKRCSDATSCNLICAPVVGKNIRHPLSALRTIPQLFFKSRPSLPAMEEKR
jgi:MoaA/NifB/PqqE/SkfB family radical SAM enzyme